MATTILDGRTLARMFAGGLKNIRIHKTEIDDLNVFPVPDGDTGSNMTMTIENGVNAITSAAPQDVGKLMEVFAQAAMLGARGNSGVILSQIFKGIQKGLSSYQTVTVAQFAAAYKSGVEQSYRAVVKPVEGTILTVFREATEAAAKSCSGDCSFETFFTSHIAQAKETLSRTKEMLPALREADVIDSGGAGYVAIAEGMYNALLDEHYVEESDSAPSEIKKQQIDINGFTRDSVLQFGYCTEFLLRLQSSKVDVDNFDINRILDFLKAENGQSVVAYKDGDIIKVHVHTMNPGNVLNECRKYGEFLTVKIENMALQHEETTRVKQAQKKRLAVVAVSSGDGISQLFTSLGADAIVSGGQTQNPSSGDFINAFSTLNAETILVLPDNSNVLLTAQQAAKMYDRANVRVIPTKTMQQGFCALSLITPAFTDIDSLINDITEAIRDVTSGSVALAVRDAKVEGREIHKGDWLGMIDDDIVAVAVDKVSALLAMIEKIDGIKDKELFTLFCGDDVSQDESTKALSLIKEQYPDIECTKYDGGQEVYSFLLAAE